MEIKLTKYIIAVLAITFALTGCSKSSDELATVAAKVNTTGYVIKDGYIKFENVQNYDRIIKSMTKMNPEVLNSFCLSLGISSLYDSYNKVGSPIDSLNQRVEDSYLSRLLNKDGILMVGDTILKIVNENAYIIPDGDFQKSIKIAENPELSKELGIKVIKHSKVFTKEFYNDNTGMSRLRGGSSVYDGNVETGLIKPGTNWTPREERVKLSAFCVVSPFPPFGLTYIGAAMNGEARQKDVCFFGCGWGGWFADEIVHGKITINSGSYGYAPSYQWSVVPGYLDFTVPATEFKIGREYGAYNDMSAKNLNITYIYEKTVGRPQYTTNIIWQ